MCILDVLKSTSGFIDSVFRLADVSLVCPHYTGISRRAKDVEISFKPSTHDTIRHLVIDATVLKVMATVNGKLRSMAPMASEECGANFT
ncbi:mobile element protein [Vibrio variabilis]|uniref:Mobile element protein n=1 Tax=Vibrio variabilis TaxID=990271 RepID=A0ABQ0J7P3_9VIBR|nr:mobile element protein [Vibrio variabilis]